MGHPSKWVMLSPENIKGAKLSALGLPGCEWQTPVSRKSISWGGIRHEVTRTEV